MKRLTRAALILFVALGLLACAIVVLIRVLPETELVRKTVESRLHDLTARRVVLGSLHVSASFPGLVHLALQGISVQADNGDELFSAEKVEFSPALWPLLRRELHIESIVVDRFKVSIIRLADGTVSSPFVPVAVPSDRTKKQAPGDTPSPAEAQGTPAVSRDQSAAGPTELKWSLKSFSLVNGSVEWIDRHVSPGRDTVIRLQDVNCRLNQAEPQPTVSVDISARLTGEKPEGNGVKIDGSFVPSTDLSRVERVKLRLAAESADLKPFQAYFPRSAVEGSELGPAKIVVQLDWETGTSPVASFQASLREKGGTPARLDLDGTLAAQQDFASITEIQFKSEIDSFALKGLSGFLNPSFPLDPSSGVVKGKISGKWLARDNWTAEGSLAIDQSVPVGNLGFVGKPLSLSLQARLQPLEMTIAGFEISAPLGKASVSGKLGEPLSGDPRVDLRVEGAISAMGTKVLAMKIPNGLRMEGGLPVRGKVLGKIGALAFDLSCDMKNAAVGFAPYVRKPSGHNGSLVVKGTFGRSGPNGRRGPNLDCEAHLKADQVTVALTPKGPSLPGQFVRLDGKVSVRGHKIDIKDAGIAILKTGEGGEILVGRGTLTDAGSAAATVKAAGSIKVDQKILELAGLDPGSNISLKGTLPVSAKVAGPLTGPDWWLDVPFTGDLEIAAKNVFRKPAGVTGSLKASGKSSGKEVTISAASMKLPGLEVNCSGVASDGKGAFKELSIDLKKGNIEKFQAYFPELKGKGLSGPVAATVKLGRSEKGVSPTGTIHLAEVTFRQEKAPWSLEKITGTVEVRDNSLDIPDISGRIAGLVEGPFKVKGTLQEISSVGAMNGRLSLDVGKGRVKADSLAVILKEAKAITGMELSPQLLGQAGDFRDFDYLKGDVTVGSGAAKTDNLRLKGAEISAGAIGSLRLDSQQLDALVGLRTEMAISDALGKIGPIRDLVERHKDFIKNTGLDRELRRIGITLPGSKGENEASPGGSKTPVTVIVRMKGPSSSPQVVPVLEASLDKNTAEQLKKLMQ